MAEPLSSEAAATLRALLVGSDAVTVDLEVDRTAVDPAPAHDNPAVDECAAGSRGFCFSPAPVV